MVVGLRVMRGKVKRTSTPDGYQKAQKEEGIKEQRMQEREILKRREKAMENCGGGGGGGEQEYWLSKAYLTPVG